MRDPNISIKISALSKVFSKLGIQGVTIEEFAEACRPHKCSNRVMINTNARTKKKINRLLQSDENDTELFTQLLLAADTEERHNLKYLKFVNKGTREYTNLSEAAVIAVEYATSYEMSRADGMQEFIITGIKLMRRKFAVNRFKSVAGKIFDAKRVLMLMQGEGLKQGAIVAKVYFKKLEEETKVKYEEEITNDMFVNFIYAYEDIQNAKANVNDWIEAQFAGLAFMDVLPEINQIHGEGAGKRYLSHKFGKLVKKNGKTETEIDLSMMSKEQKEYFKNL